MDKINKLKKINILRCGWLTYKLRKFDLELWIKINEKYLIPNSLDRWEQRYLEDKKQCKNSNLGSEGIESKLKKIKEKYLLLREYDQKLYDDEIKQFELNLELIKRGHEIFELEKNIEENKDKIVGLLKEMHLLYDEKLQIQKARPHLMDLFVEKLKQNEISISKDIMYDMQRKADAGISKKAINQFETAIKNLGEYQELLLS